MDRRAGVWSEAPHHVSLREVTATAGGSGQYETPLPLLLNSIEVEGIRRVGGQDGEERHSGTTCLVHKHGIT
jgi:hypothetical protein